LPCPIAAEEHTKWMRGVAVFPQREKSYLRIVVGRGKVAAVHENYQWYTSRYFVPSLHCIWTCNERKPKRLTPKKMKKGKV
jgi:hypothetical protein